MRIGKKTAITASLLSILVLVAVGGLALISCGGDEEEEPLVEPAPTEPPLVTPAPAEQTLGDIIELHSDLTQVATAECVECHGDKSQEQSLDPDIDSPHVTHMPILKDCNVCHKSADLLQGSAASLMKQVSAEEVCAQCHGPGGPGRQLYGAEEGAELATPAP